MKTLRLITSLSFSLGLGQFEAWAAGSDVIVTITNADNIHRLSREAASQNYPVKLTGVVTYSDVQWNVLFVQDASAGVYVSLAVGNYPTNSELVEIIGHTEDGSFLPVVAGASWRHLGVAPMPEPRRIIQPERFAGEIDSGWSELVGVVRRIELNAEKNHLQLEVADGEWRARVFLPAPDGQYPKVLDDLIDAKISVVGVGGVEDVSPQNGTSLKCFVPNPGLIGIREPAPTETLPNIPLARVLSLSGTNLPAHRVHVRGVATYLKSPNELVIQEDNSAMRVLVANTGQF